MRRHDPRRGGFFIGVSFRVEYPIDAREHEHRHQRQQQQDPCSLRQCDHGNDGRTPGRESTEEVSGAIKHR